MFHLHLKTLEARNVAFEVRIYNLARETYTPLSRQLLVLCRGNFWTLPRQLSVLRQKLLYRGLVRKGESHREANAIAQHSGDTTPCRMTGVTLLIADVTV